MTTTVYFEKNYNYQEIENGIYKVCKLSNETHVFYFFIQIELQFNIVSFKITSLGSHTAQDTVLPIITAGCVVQFLGY